MLESLPPGESFPLNYSRANIDRVALHALNQVFPPQSVAAARTKYHRARLNFDDLKENLMKFSSPKPPRNVEPSYLAAVNSVRRDLGLYNHKIIPLTTGAVAKHPDLPATKSPGLPWKLRGYKTKGEAVADPAVLHEIRKTWYDIESNKNVELPDVACFARAQICPREKNKVRATWGYSLTVYMAEAAYFYPILDILKTHPEPIIAYGLEMANGGMSFIHSAAQRHAGRPYLMGDWSGFDSTVPAWLIRDAFKLIEEAIDWDHVMDSEGKIWPVRAYRSKRRWRKLISYFIDTPIRLSNGERFIKHSGVPSGACFTNIIDSIVNAIVMRYLTYELTGELPIFDVYLGDDSVLILNKILDLGVLSDLAAKTFGMDFNRNKSSISYQSEHIYFLGYFNHQGQPRKPLDTIVASTVYPEHTVRDKIETISRLVGQGYSCFEPTDALAFFKAAHIVATEEDIERSDVETFIHNHPHRFKYLQTIGVDPKGVSFPLLDGDGVLLITQPSNPKRVYQQRSYDVDALYEEALVSLSHLFNLEFEDDTQNSLLDEEYDPG